MEDPLKRVKELAASLPEIRQVRFKKVTFSFHLFDLGSLGIGGELAELVRNLKSRLEPCLGRFGLPKVVRIAVWNKNPFADDSCGTFGGCLPLLSTPFQICINTDNLHEEELSIWNDSAKWRFRLMHVFIHELAHFVTTDEKEANRIAFETLRRMSGSAYACS